MKFPSMNRKFGNKMYAILYVVFTNLSNTEKNAKERVMKYAQKLRDYGFSARVQKEVIVRYPKNGPEVVFNVCARKEGMTRDEVIYFGQRVLGNSPPGSSLYYKLSGRWTTDEQGKPIKKAGGKQ